MNEKELLERLFKESEELPTLKEYFLREYNAATDDEDRALILESLLGWAKAEQWAWDAVAQIIEESDDPLPAPLKDFVLSAFKNELRPPSIRRKGPKPKHDKKNQIRWLVRELTKRGYSQKRAWEITAEKMYLSPETVRTHCDDSVRGKKV